MNNKKLQKFDSKAIDSIMEHYDPAKPEEFQDMFQSLKKL